MEPGEPPIELIDADITRVRANSAAPVLHGITWRIAPGEFWAVGATPGSGKTDLLSTAAALQRPAKGFHLVFGKDTREMDEQELVNAHKKIGMVFEGGRLFPSLTVGANLELPLAYHSGTPAKQVSRRVDEVLELTGLRHLRDSRPNQITRNLHQRIGLARALALDPEVLLIDGPLQGIDPRQGRWWLDFLCKLNKGHSFFGNRPITIAIAADDLRPWTDMARQFGVLKEGRLQVIGDREALRKTSDAIVHELLSPAFDAS